MAGGQRLDAVHQPRRGCGDGVENPRLGQLAQRDEAGGHRQGIAGERAGLIHRPDGRHHLHDRTFAGVCAHGQPAADHLAQAGQVRIEPP